MSNYSTFSRKSSFSKRRYNNRASKRRLTRWRSGNRDRARFLRKLDEFRSRLLPGSIDTLCWAEWKVKFQMARNYCSYCQLRFDNLEIDHIVPLSRGGNNTIDNVTPCCRKCNASKGSKLLEEWEQTASGAADVRTEAGLVDILPHSTITTEIKEEQNVRKQSETI